MLGIWFALLKDMKDFFFGRSQWCKCPSPPLAPPCNLAKGYQIVNKFFFFWSSPWDSLLLKFLSVGFTESFSFASNHTLTLYRNPHIVVLTWENNLNFDVALLVLPKRWCNCVRFFFFLIFIYLFLVSYENKEKKKSYVIVNAKKNIIWSAYHSTQELGIRINTSEQFNWEVLNSKNLEKVKAFLTS